MSREVHAVSRKQRHGTLLIRSAFHEIRFANDKEWNGAPVIEDIAICSNGGVVWK